MEDNKKLNIVMFPWLAFGHIIPFLDLSKHLATKGHHIFFVSTPRNLERLPKIPERLATLITLVPLLLPRVDNLPPGAEATSDVGFEIGTNLLKKAFDGLQQPMTEFLLQSSCCLDWIIYDFCCYWIPPIADKLGICKVYFNITAARTLSAFPTKLMEAGSGTWTDPCCPPPWIPFPKSSVYFLQHESRNITHTARNITSSGVSDGFRVKCSVSGCDLIVVRSWRELEAEYLQLAEVLNEKTVLPLGLLPPSLEDQGLGDDDDSWKLINSWLNKQRKGSVVYVAFGSEFEPNQDQLMELALGLEQSGLPFFWAFRRSEVSILKLPEGFEERTRGQGMVWTSWAPQLRILSHESVGGFLTHCGWSSIIEALQFGKPLVMLPLAIDHGLIARFMSQDKKVGIEIPRNTEDGSLTRSSVAESLTLVLQDETGKMFKDEAEKLSIIFADKSMNGQYVDEFSEYLCNHKPKIRQQSDNLVE
ncbi:putative UDP-rhamnose:rhamnosyltransferase 1 [Chenopodium quinoa]|uniref:putative UDP-rhamnose:rhamnosyltransferase 1 n=1 Tax=Chenopodium quinoa TaxID=63459 RepID=UPI000B7854D8|nr:putative UDP-rhamnose:rhamnosyltransferase 1 [Chenopodium quinoa]